MNQHDERKVVAILERASTETVGVEIELLDLDAAKVWRQRLYEVRKKMPEYKTLVIIPRDHCIWIVKDPEAMPNGHDETD